MYRCRIDSQMDDYRFCLDSYRLQIDISLHRLALASDRDYIVSHRCAPEFQQHRMNSRQFASSLQRFASTLHRYCVDSHQLPWISNRYRIDIASTRIGFDKCCIVLHRFSSICLKWQCFHIVTIHIFLIEITPTWLRFASTSHRYRIGSH